MWKKQEYQQQLDQEIERRIERMEQKDFLFPKRFGRKDYLFAASVVLVCLFLVILGSWM